MLDASQNTMIITNSLLKEYDICHFAASSKHLLREAYVSTSPRTSHASQNVAHARRPENVNMLNEFRYGTDETIKKYQT
jgi:hypothetical protein